MLSKEVTLSGVEALKITDTTFTDTWIVVNPNHKLTDEDGIVIQIAEAGKHATVVISFDDWAALKELM